MKTLDVGDRFPSMSATAVDGSHFSIPDEIEGLRAVLVFYRGHW